MPDDIIGCKHLDRHFIQSSQYAGEHDTGREDVMICSHCGALIVSVEKNRQWSRVIFRLPTTQMAELAGTWARMIEAEP